MRISYIILVLIMASINVAQAETFKVSTSKFPEAEAVASLLKEVYQQLGHDIELVFRPAKRSLVEVNSGEADAELARVIGTETEYPNLVRVGEPVYALSMSAIVKADSKIWLSSWSELQKYSIGYPRGYRILDIRTRDLNAQQVSDSSAVVRMVKGGRFEVGIAITTDALMLAADNPDITVLTPPIESITLYHYLNVKHRRLAPSIEKLLVKLNDSGRAKEILYKSN